MNPYKQAFGLKHRIFLWKSGYKKVGARIVRLSSSNWTQMHIHNDKGLLRLWCNAYGLWTDKRSVRATLCIIYKKSEWLIAIPMSFKPRRERNRHPLYMPDKWYNCHGFSTAVSGEWALSVAFSNVCVRRALLLSLFQGIFLEPFACCTHFTL